MWCKNEVVTTALEPERPPSKTKSADKDNGSGSSGAEAVHTSKDIEVAEGSSPKKRKSVLKGLIKTIRPHQWVKNVFVMAPMVFHKDLLGTAMSGDPTLNLKVAGKAFLATAVFCLLAGAVYTINDLVDVEADRVHPVKRARPIASGAVPEGFAKIFAAALVVLSLGFAAVKLNIAFAGVALLYLVENLAYSFKLKKVAFLDVGLIAFGFVLRVVAGGLATDTHVSWYMLACTAGLALFLGFGKRRHELEGEHAGKQRAALEAYSKTSLTVALAVTGALTAATYVAYTLDKDTEAFFQTKYLWLTVPFTVFGIFRFLMLVSGKAGRGLKAESPTQEMLSDVPFVVNLVLWVFVILGIVYRIRFG